MKKSEIMFHAAQAAEALDAQFKEEGAIGVYKYAGMWRGISAMGGQIEQTNGKHAVSLFGFPFATADDKKLNIQ